MTQNKSYIKLTIAETDVSVSTLVSVTAMETTKQRVKRTSVTPLSVELDTRDDDPGPRTSAAASYLVYITPITCTLTVFLLAILNKKRQINSDYELPARVYENNGSTNCYDTPDTNLNISPTQGTSESSYEIVEHFQKDL